MRTDFAWEPGSIWKARSWKFLALIFGKSHFPCSPFVQKSLATSSTCFSSSNDSSNISDLKIMFLILFLPPYPDSTVPINHVDGFQCTIYSWFFTNSWCYNICATFMTHIYNCILNIITENSKAQGFQIQNVSSYCP